MILEYVGQRHRVRRAILSINANLTAWERRWQILTSRVKVNNAAVRAVWLCGRQCDSYFPDLGKVDRGDGASLCAVTVKLFRKVGISVEGVRANCRAGDRKQEKESVRAVVEITHRSSR
jgi:hypothetical protein